MVVPTTTGTHTAVQALHTRTHSVPTAASEGTVASSAAHNQLIALLHIGDFNVCPVRSCMLPLPLCSSGSEPALLNYEALAQLYAFRRDAAAARSAIAAGLSCRRPTARFLRTAALVEKRLGDDSAAAQLLLRAVARAPRDYRSWLAVREAD